MSQADSPVTQPKFRPKDARTVLVDASGYIFRAYYGLPPLTNSAGRPTQATFGFLKMLGRLVQSIAPERLVLAFDAAAPTFRKELYSEYKANRPPPPPDLIPQFEDIHTMVDLLGVASVTMPGYEADDILATLAEQAKADGQTPVIVVSSDKDLLQLVDDNVQVWDTLKKVIYNDDEVRQKMGVGPKEIPDYLGLVGDSTDNIPGVRGIGRKSATTLIQNFGNIEQVFDKVEQTPPRCIKKLKAEGAREQAVLSRKLARVCEDAPLPTNLAQLWATQRHDAALSHMLQELNIPVELSRFPNPVPRAPQTAPVAAQTPTPNAAPVPVASAPTRGMSAPSTFLRPRVDPSRVMDFRAIVSSCIGDYELTLQQRKNRSDATKGLRAQLKILALLLDIFPTSQTGINPAYADDFGHLLEEIWSQNSSQPILSTGDDSAPLDAEITAALERMLQARPGWEFLGLRLPQLEERILAELSGEPALISAFRDQADPYEQMASIFFSLLPGMATAAHRHQLRILHQGLLMDTAPKAIGAALGWSTARARTALLRHQECFPAMTAFRETAARRFETEGSLTLLSGTHIAWSSEIALRQHPGFRLTQSPPNPAWATIRESCRELYRVTTHKALTSLGSQLGSAPTGHCSSSGVAVEIPQDQSDTIESQMMDVMTNTFELGIPLVVHSSRGQSLVSV